jgi:hypothetical protein
MAGIAFSDRRAKPLILIVLIHPLTTLYTRSCHLLLISRCQSTIYVLFEGQAVTTW